jgi:hypothetical protein
MRAKMEAEHLYHCLRHFFKVNPKIYWEKNELQDAIKEQYMKLLNGSFTAEPGSEVTPRRVLFDYLNSPDSVQSFAIDDA